MIRTGVFTIVNGESRLGDGTLLAVCSDPSPLVAARPFLLGRQCQPNHWIEVTGTDGTIGSVTVFCMTDARPIAAPPAEMIRAATAMSMPSKPQAKKKKRAKKRTTKGKKPAPAKPKKGKKKTTIRRRRSR